MKANDKIYISKYLNYLNNEVKNANIYHRINPNDIKLLTCKELAKNCEVTPATISNLSTSSSYYLLDKIANEILDAYYAYFMYDESKTKKEYPDEIIYPRDKNYILMYLTNYYSGEWLAI